MSLLPLRVVPEPRALFCSPESFWTPEVLGDLLLPTGRSPPPVISHPAGKLVDVVLGASLSPRPVCPG